MNHLIVRLEDDQLEDLAVRIANMLSPSNRQPLSVAQAARALGLSAGVIQSRVNAGVIKRVPDTGRRMLIPRSEIERLQKGESR